MFRASSRPLSGARQLQWQPLDLPSECDGSSTVGRGWAGYNRPDHNHQNCYHHLDATISPVYYLTFIYSSTCFGRPHAHYQELNNCSGSLWIYLRSVMVAVLLVVVGLVITGPTTTIRTAITTHWRKNQRLPLQLSSWWWTWGRPNHVEL
jgi:hypothetical protein